MNIVKIGIPTLKHMDSLGFIEIMPYIHKNPLVRWLFWKRLRTALDFAGKGKKVLDFGAGSGIFMPTLSKNFEEVYSLDLDIRALEYVKKKYQLNNVTITQGSGNKLPYPNNFVDIIFATDVLEHFKDSTEIQREFRRVLKRNGCLIISGPTENFIYVLARKFMYKHKKPSDHYTNVKDVMEKTRRFFKIEKVRILPFFPIEGFKIYKARKTID